MIRTTTFFVVTSLLLTACGDGRGSQYSSARATTAPATYIPVTPGATPVTDVPAGAVPVTVVPEGTPIEAPTTLTEPVALTPNTAPVAIVPDAPAVTQAAAALPRTPAAPEPVVRFATGPIFNACKSAGRKAATRTRCGCVQWVADQELTAAQQRRGAGYFSNKQALQDVRQSSETVAANGKFWDAWKAYGASAERQCRGT